MNEFEFDQLYQNLPAVLFGSHDMQDMAVHDWYIYICVSGAVYAAYIAVHRCVSMGMLTRSAGSARWQLGVGS